MARFPIASLWNPYKSNIILNKKFISDNNNNIIQLAEQLEKLDDRKKNYITEI